MGPPEMHELVERRGDDVVFFDARNAFEAAIGRFKDAVVPEARTTRDFAALLDSGRYDHLKPKAVVTYCTGGVRCEVLSALMIRRGFEEVYQVDGGIVRYGEDVRRRRSLGGLAVPLRRPHASRVQRSYEGDRRVRTMRRAHEPVPQLRESRPVENWYCCATPARRTTSARGARHGTARIRSQNERRPAR